VEQWLREDVASTFDAMQADPSRAIPASSVFAAIKARHAGRSRKSTRRAKT